MSSSPSSSVIEARKALANRLVEIRKGAGLTGAELAARCGWHESKTSRIQNGRTVPSEEDLRAWCAACGADDQVPDLIATSRAVDSMYTEWRRTEHSGLRAEQESVAPLYQRTSLFRVYASRVLPGMVQTPEYTTAVLRSIQRHRVLVDDVEDAVDARMDRQRMLFSGRHHFGLLIEEYVLYAAVCDSSTMAGQLGQLITAASSPFVSLGIIPMGTERPHLPVEDFYMFDEAEVAVELTSGYLRITRPPEIAEYVRTFAAFASMAAHGPHARSLITKAINALG
ncbi:putative regulatory protein [Streptomyces himastatinicus ATCC 53653]|uniref:Putative regulatory protein n=1 Tax=Streptomyces himastatinicus ATCC 53653 TaxID=457427 RepID=D9WII3_9ACTN|nr:helix-turn-helix transcriptional regulator [Streptomyces himastatinicus]EFL25541.1 putative regulatory protein [Streptomyces himastatinicus ATCC 53653]